MAETAKQNSFDPKSYGPKKPDIVDIFDNRMNMSFEEKMAKLPKYDGIPPSGSKIENIHRLYYADKGENFMFVGCIRAVLEALGEPENMNYNTAMALTGDMFTQMYNKNGESDSLTDNCFIPEIAINLFRNCGYESVFVTPEEIQKHPEQIRELIIHSVLLGVPVISLGVNNIPVTVKDGTKVWNGTCPVADKKVDVPFGSLIGGYEQEKLLINVWIEEAYTDEYGYAVAENALEISRGMIFVGKQTSKIDSSRFNRSILKAIPTFLTLEPHDGYSFGKQAFYDWAENIENGEILKVSDAWNMQFAPAVILYTNSGRTKEFMQNIAVSFPDDKAIAKIAELYEEQSRLSIELDRLQGGFEFDVQRFRDAEFAAAHTAILRKLGDLQDEIIEACYEIDY